MDIPLDSSTLMSDSNANPIIRAGIFITGATGMLGSHVVKQLLYGNKNIKALYRTKIPDISSNDKITWIKGDILDPLTLDEAMEGVEEVYHCAAVVSFNPARKEELFKVNIEGTANVVNAALHARVKKLCYVSSVAALGQPSDEAIITEQTTWTEENNKSNYGKSKYLAEVEVWRGIAEGLKAVIVNPSIIVGGGNWNDSSTKIFKTIYEEFPWYSEGITGFVDVKDVVNAMIQLTESDISGERFILSAENRSFKEVFTSIAHAFQKKVPHKKVNHFLAGIVWRLEAIKSTFTGEEPMITKETAAAAQSIVRYDNNKLKKYLPSFVYTPLEDTIKRVCGELKEKNKLPS